MNRNENHNEIDIYHIPPNFIEGGTVLGGLFKLRNVIEAGIRGFCVMPTTQQSSARPLAPVSRLWIRTAFLRGSKSVKIPSKAYRIFEKKSKKIPDRSKITVLL